MKKKRLLKNTVSYWRTPMVKHPGWVTEETVYQSNRPTYDVTALMKCLQWLT